MNIRSEFTIKVNSSMLKVFEISKIFFRCNTLKASISNVNFIISEKLTAVRSLWDDAILMVLKLTLRKKQYLNDNLDDFNFENFLPFTNMLHFFRFSKREI